MEKPVIPALRRPRQEDQEFKDTQTINKTGAGAGRRGKEGEGEERDCTLKYLDLGFASPCLALESSLNGFKS